MNDTGRSRSRVGISLEAGDSERNSKRPANSRLVTLKKKNSWTNFSTKARRLSKKRRGSSTLGASKTTKESPKSLHKTTTNYEKGLEDYTAWCNHYLIRGLHREITPDLRTAIGDGVTLVNLVETLSGRGVRGVHRQPATWSQKLDNIHSCFQFLNSEGVRITGISPEDIIEGRLRSILGLFQRLETHFEDTRYSNEKKLNESQSRSPLAGYSRNGRISSGYHSEDDAYMNGRTTPTIVALPGLLAGSDSDADNCSIDSSVLHLHYDGKLAPPHSETISYSSRTQHIKAERSLDNIGYMPSHPSRRTRTSSKSKYDENHDGLSWPENSSFHQQTAVSSSHVKLESADHAAFSTLKDDEPSYGRDNHGLDFTASDFGIDDTTSMDRGSISSTGTPVLPDLSSASSFEDLPLDFSSDASCLQARDSFTTARLSQDSFNDRARFGSTDVQRQIDGLHSMYEKLLTIVDKESVENRRKTKLSLPRVAMLQVKGKNSNKQRTKDMKSVKRRFNRIEANVVTLARNIDHLRTEIRSQAETSQQLDELRADVNEFKDSIFSGGDSHNNRSQRSRDYDQRLRRLKKLKSFFGEEPPMAALLLQKMGYERFIPHFKAEEIGILELPYMTEQRLQNLGIPLGPRLRILEEIQNLR